MAKCTSKMGPSPRIMTVLGKGQPTRADLTNIDRPRTAALVLVPRIIGDFAQQHCLFLSFTEC